MADTGFRLGIDFGTSNTVAVLRWPDGRTKPLLFDGSPLLPSAVYVEAGGSVLTGRDAVHSARLQPHRFEPYPKRRVEEGTAWLGEREIPVIDLVASVLRRVATEAVRVAGGAPAQVTVTHPATWPPQRRQALSQATVAAGLPAPALSAEPIAAASYFVGTVGTHVPVGGFAVVYDFGAGTFDASVVRRNAGGGFDVLSSEGLPDAGGLDVDAAVVAYLGRGLAGRGGDQWHRLTHPENEQDRRAAWQLWEDARLAKEMLSRAATTYVHVPLFDESVPIGREQLEELAKPILDRTVLATQLAVTAAGINNVHLSALFLVGGSSRIPLAATLLHRAFGLAPTAIEQPELVVAEGALLSAPPTGRAVVGGAAGANAAPTSPPPGSPVPGQRAPVSPVSGSPISGSPVTSPISGAPTSPAYTTPSSAPGLPPLMPTGQLPAVPPQAPPPQAPPPQAPPRQPVPRAVPQQPTPPPTAVPFAAPPPPQTPPSGWRPVSPPPPAVSPVSPAFGHVSGPPGPPAQPTPFTVPSAASNLSRATFPPPAAPPSTARRGTILALTVGAGALALILIIAGIVWVANRDDGAGPSGLPTTQAAPAASPACGYKIAYLGLSSGNGSADGVMMRDATRMAIEEFNRKDPKCQVEMVDYDTQGKTEVTVELANKLINDDKVLGVVGPVYATEINDAAPILNGAGLPLITPFAPEVDLAQKGWKVFHRLIGNDKDQAAAGARYLRAQFKVTKAYLVVDDTPFGAVAKNEVAAVLGSGVIGTVSIKRADKDFTAAVQQVVAANPEGVYFAGAYDDGAIFLKQLRTAKPDLPVVSGDKIFTQSFVNTTAGTVNGVVITCPCVPADQADQNFAGKFKERFSRNATYYGAEAYDATTIYLSGLRAGKATRAGMLDYVKAYEARGIARQIKFTASGDLDVKDLQIWAYKVVHPYVERVQVIPAD